MSPIALAARYASPASQTAWILNDWRLLLVHRTIMGVRTTAPATLPSHHVNHIAPKFSRSAYPANHKLPTPTVALMRVPGPRPSSANFATPPGVSNVVGPPDHRVIR